MKGVKVSLTTAVNANLLKGTSVNGVAKEWTKLTPPSKNYRDLVSFNNVALPKDSTTFIVSFEAKSTNEGDKIISFFYYPSNITSALSSQGNKNKNVDGYMPIILTTKYTKYWICWEAPKAASRSVIIARLYSDSVGGMVSIKNVKLEVGSIPTDWCANSADIQGG